MTKIRTLLFTDGPAVLTLLATALVVAWPILRGGYLTYADNPVHIAEIFSLAFTSGNGWSDVSYCGLPLGHLHSPLWYGIMGLFVRAGLPLGPPYAFMVFVGYLAPALVLYHVARRRLRPLFAGILAWMLLMQRPAFFGLGSALGGMWTFYIAAAAFILLIDRLGRRPSRPRDHVWIATLVGVMCLTHLYSAVPLAALAVIHLIRSGTEKPFDLRTLTWQAGSAALGLAGASVYWLPYLLTRGHLVIQAEHLSPASTIIRLLFPSSILTLLFEQKPDFSVHLVLHALPMLLLAAAGMAGLIFLRKPGNHTPIYGALTAGVVFVLLTVIATTMEAQFLGPLSWRLLYFVRIGLALTAIPLFVWLARRTEKWRWREAGVALGIAGVLLGFYFGSPLRNVVTLPQDPEMDDVRSVWQWLRDNRSDEWGRVFMQDTFMTPPLEKKLALSHVLALTAKETGVLQLGAVYGLVPFPTARWSIGEFGTLFGRKIDSAQELRLVPDLMRLANATHMVTADPETGRNLLSTSKFELMFQTGRYSVLRLRGRQSQWLMTGDMGDLPNQENIRVDLSPGRIGIQFGAGSVPDPLVVKVAYHPFWRLEGDGDAVLAAHESDLMKISGLDAVQRQVELVYRPPVWPWFISIAGWLGILGMGLFSNR